MCWRGSVSRVNPDTALLTGLLHGVGRLYIMTRAVQYPALFANLASYQAIERDWHLERRFGAARELGSRGGDRQCGARLGRPGARGRGPVNLTDVLVAANLIVNHEGDPVLLGVRLQSVPAVARLQLDAEACEA